MVVSAARADDEAPDARYERLLEAHDYKALADALHGAMEGKGTAGPALAWEKRHFASGGGLFVSAMYALDLLALARAAGGSATALKETAVAVAFHALALIETDGLRCIDPSAPRARRRQFGLIFAPIGETLAALPDEAVTAAIAEGLTQERVTADLRPDDDYLCRGLTPDIPPALADDAKAVEPEFRPPEAWRDEAAAARALLPLAMAGLAADLKARAGR